MRPSFNQNDWNGVLEDVRRTIERWFFWVSVTGVVYVTPRGGSLDPEDLNDMIRRLNIICDDDFPSLIAFEFPQSVLQSESWDVARRRLRQFAADVQASFRLLTEDQPSGVLVLLHRNTNRSQAAPPRPEKACGIVERELAQD